MKNMKVLFAAIACAILAGCMNGDWDEPADNVAPYGNNALTQTNVVTIADLKTQYQKVINSGDTMKVTAPTQIVATVTGNDIEGNLYNQVSVSDGTGAILICIAQGGLFGYLPVGQQILVELKDLYIGSYGKMPEIGTPYTSKSGSTYVSRMNRSLWQEHFKLLDKTTVTPEIFDQDKISNSSYMAENCGKLMTIERVKIKEADGTATFAPGDGSVTLTANMANRNLRNEKNMKLNNIVLRTSTYADFANNVMPTGLVNITGVFTRFNNTWQILLRSVDDIEVIE